MKTANIAVVRESNAEPYVIASELEDQFYFALRQHLDTVLYRSAMRGSRLATMFHNENSPQLRDKTVVLNYQKLPYSIARTIGVSMDLYPQIELI
jgi:hypothetical protein